MKVTAPMVVVQLAIVKSVLPRWRYDQDRGIVPCASRRGPVQWTHGATPAKGER